MLFREFNVPFGVYCFTKFEVFRSSTILFTSHEHWISQSVFKVIMFPTGTKFTALFTSVPDICCYSTVFVHFYWKTLFIA